MTLMENRTTLSLLLAQSMRQAPQSDRIGHSNETTDTPIRSDCLLERNDGHPNPIGLPTRTKRRTCTLRKKMKDRDKKWKFAESVSISPEGILEKNLEKRRAFQLPCKGIAGPLPRASIASATRLRSSRCSFEFVQNSGSAMAALYASTDCRLT